MGFSVVDFLGVGVRAGCFVFMLFWMFCLHRNVACQVVVEQISVYTFNLASG